MCGFCNVWVCVCVGFAMCGIYIYMCVCVCVCVCRPGSSVGIATELRAGRFGDRIPVGARFSSPVQTGPGAHPASYTMRTVFFPGSKVRPGRAADHSPRSSDEGWEE